MVASPATGAAPVRARSQDRTAAMRLLERIARAIGLVTPEPMPCPRCHNDELLALANVKPVPPPADADFFQCRVCGWVSLWDTSGPVPLLVRNQQ